MFRTQRTTALGTRALGRTALGRTALAVAAAAAVLAPVGAGAGPASEDAQQAEASHGDRCRLPGPYELPHGAEPVRLHPRDFTTRIDNTYWPMQPGTTWRYRETDADGTQTVRVVVTDRTRMVAGIRARVVHDVVRADGELVENTFDWYAQDSGGSIWYLGENTKEYEDGQVVSTEGSWEHGVDGGKAGVLVPARPRPGCRYRQEQAPDAKDRGAVLSVLEDVKIGGRLYRDVLTTSDTTPLTPGLVEHKFYARHLGLVLAIEVAPSPAREVLVDVERPRHGR